MKKLTKFLFTLALIASFVTLSSCSKKENYSLLTEEDFSYFMKYLPIDRCKFIDVKINEKKLNDLKVQLDDVKHEYENQNKPTSDQLLSNVSIFENVEKY